MNGDKINAGSKSVAPQRDDIGELPTKVLSSESTCAVSIAVVKFKYIKLYIKLQQLNSNISNQISNWICKHLQLKCNYNYLQPNSPLIVNCSSKRFSQSLKENGKKLGAKLTLQKSHGIRIINPLTVTPNYIFNYVIYVNLLLLCLICQMNMENFIFYYL